MPIVFYHNLIAEPPDPFDQFCRIHVDAFAREITDLAEHCHPVSLPALLAQLDAGQSDPRAVAITFDDACYGVYEHAFPLLERLGIPATVFVITGTLDSPKRLLHNDEIEMAFRTSRIGELPPETPGGPTYPLTTLGERMEAMRQHKRRMKVLPEAERALVHSALLERLEVTSESCWAAAQGEARFRLMAPRHLRALRDAGWTLGSHTRSHRTLSCLDEQDLHREVHGSLADMQRDFGVAE
ncbi:MAG: polysaccharide deacetylase family protein, partial [Acidobacteriota bacterium]